MKIWNLNYFYEWPIFNCKVSGQLECLGFDLDSKGVNENSKCCLEVVSSSEKWISMTSSFTKAHTII